MRETALDLTDLEAPEPMQRILEEVARLQPGERLVALTPCVPRPLLPRLRERGLAFSVEEREDGCGVVTVWRPA